MKILVASKYGDILALMHSIMIEEGVDVIAYVDENDYKYVYDGILEKRDDFINLIKIADKNEDIIYFDYTGFGNIGYELQKRGYKVYGGFLIADKLETREYAFNINKRLGIKQPESYEFNEIVDALKFIEENKKLYVVKVNSTSASDTFVPKQYYEETIFYLENLKDVNKILLQEKIDGIEITLTLRFHKGELLYNLIDSTIEEKRAYAGNLGVNTGCESSVIIPNTQNLLDRVVSFDWLQFIEKSQYTGIIDFNLMFKDNQFYFLEYTPRSGYNYEYAYRQLLDVPYIQYLRSIAGGDMEATVKRCFAGALRITTPPLPIKDFSNKSSRFKINQFYTNTYPIYAYVENDDLYTKLPAIFEVACCGEKVEDIENMTMKQAEQIVIPNKQYRIDAFERAKKDIDILKKMNIINIDNKEVKL